MILYLGTSALVKLYAAESNSWEVREWVKNAEIVATCRVAYTEIISALDKRLQKNDLTEHDYTLILGSLNRDWPDFAVVDFDEREAGRLIKKYGLRRFDAIHLSAAKLISQEQEGISISFASADEQLNRTAKMEGFVVPL